MKTIYTLSKFFVDHSVVLRLEMIHYIWRKKPKGRTGEIRFLGDINLSTQTSVYCSPFQKIKNVWCSNKELP